MRLAAPSLNQRAPWVTTALPEARRGWAPFLPAWETLRVPPPSLLGVAWGPYY